MMVAGNGWKKQIGGDARHGRGKYRFYCTVIIDGKRRQRCVTQDGHSDKSSDKALKDWVDSLRDVPEEGAKTLREWAVEWCDWRRSLGRWTDSTCGVYEGNIRRLCDTKLGGMQLDRITRADCVGVLTSMRKQRGWSNSTAYSYQSTLSSCLERAVALDMMAKNPLAGEPRPQRRIATPRRVIPDETLDFVRTSLSELPLDGHVMAMWLVLELGLRRSEACWLLDADVGLHRLRVSRSKSESGTGRTLPLSGRLAGLCDLWRALKAKAGIRSEWFCCQWDGRQITPASLSCWWKRHGERVSGGDWTLHEFRHTLATKMGAAGVSAVVLMQVFGWSTPSMAAIYCHEERDAVDAAFGRLPGI